MDAQTETSQTMSEFFAPRKSVRVWRIILAVLTTLMIIGAAYEFSKPKPEPVRMSYSTGTDTYVYLDVQLLSDWVYDVSGDEAYTFYEAMDPDGNWYIVSLDQKTFDTLLPYVDAYNAYFTDDYQNYAYPKPVRLTGMPSYISYEDVAQLASYYQVTSAEVTDYFGPNYLNEGASNAAEGAVLYLIGVMIFGLFLLAVAAQIGFVNRNYKKSDARLYELGLTDEAEAQFSSPESARFDKAKLILSADFAFSGSSGWVLPYEDIGWLYQRKQRSYGITVATHLMAGLVNGKTVYLASRHVNDGLVTQVAQATLRKNPNCLIGYSFENIRLYGQRVKEYKASHPK